MRYILLHQCLRSDWNILLHQCWRSNWNILLHQYLRSDWYILLPIMLNILIYACCCCCCCYPVYLSLSINVSLFSLHSFVQHINTLYNATLFFSLQILFSPNSSCLFSSVLLTPFLALFIIHVILHMDKPPLVFIFISKKKKKKNRASSPAVSVGLRRARVLLIPC